VEGTRGVELVLSQWEFESCKNSGQTSEDLQVDGCK